MPVPNACWELLGGPFDPDHKLPVHSFALPGHDYGHASVFHLRNGDLHGVDFTCVDASAYFFITGAPTEKFESDESPEDEILTFCAHLAGVGIEKPVSNLGNISAHF
ncbi:hypothetical protein F5Y05DRAFT_410811 [Hypoxylon sp. FL0543]|nr:hypothetical protein F5Y05DRAFT_410811 [Hypoxylon sp. FL0543]